LANFSSPSLFNSNDALKNTGKEAKKQQTKLQPVAVQWLFNRQLQFQLQTAYKRRQRANSAEKWGKKIVACVVLFSIFFFYKPYGKSRWGKWGKTDDLPLK